MSSDPTRFDLDKLRIADLEALKESLAFTLKFEIRKHRHDAYEYMARSVADRLIRDLDKALERETSEEAVVASRTQLGDQCCVCARRRTRNAPQR